jgi:hypothetical protein
MKTGYTVLLLIACFVIVDNMISTADTIKEPDNPKSAIASKQEAKDRALVYTGFDKLGLKFKANEIECKLVVIADDRTLFTSKRIDGNQIWEVKIPKVPIGKGEKTIERDFKVYLEPATGQLLKIISVSDEVGSSDTLPEPIASKTEKSLKERGVVYHGPPKESPAVSFAQALSVCLMSPETAKVIKGLYVDYSINNVRYPNTWIIILRGTETLMMVTGPSPEQVPINQRNSNLCAVNAVTGNLEYCGSAPRDREQIKRDKNMK